MLIDIDVCIFEIIGQFIKLEFTIKTGKLEANATAMGTYIIKGNNGLTQVLQRTKPVKITVTSFQYISIQIGSIIFSPGILDKISQNDAPAYETRPFFCYTSDIWLACNKQYLLLCSGHFLPLPFQRWFARFYTCTSLCCSTLRGPIVYNSFLIQIIKRL